MLVRETRESRCESCLRDPFIGHEKDSNPRRSERRDTRGSTGVPDHSPPIPPKRRE